MKASNRVTAELLIAIPAAYPLARVWRSNAGGGVGESQVRAAIACARAGDCRGVIDALSRRMKFGVEGGADISGIFGILICLDCVLPRVSMGQCPRCGSARALEIGCRLEVEVKTGDDRMREAQLYFERMCHDLGVVHAVAGSCEEGLSGIAAWVAAMLQALGSQQKMPGCAHPEKRGICNGVLDQ